MNEKIAQHKNTVVKYMFYNQNKKFQKKILNYNNNSNNTHLGTCLVEKLEREFKDQKLRGKFITSRREDVNLSGGCFGWLSEWSTCPMHTVAALCELYVLVKI